MTTEIILGVGGMTCNGCVNNVKNAVNKISGVSTVVVDLESSQATINIDENGPSKKELEATITDAGYSIHEPGTDFLQLSNTPKKVDFNWADKSIWLQSAHNTKWCLIGCSIGEFGTLAAYTLFTISYTTGTSWYYFLLILPLINGLITSVMLETGILMRGQMDFRNALSTALGMSFISMLMMEIAMEITDLLFMDGKLGLSIIAIPFMLIIGFITPWPYNYWRLKKYGVACH